MKYEASWLEYAAPRNDEGDIIEVPDNWFVGRTDYCTASHPDPNESDGWHELEMMMEFEADTLAIARDRVRQAQDGTDVYNMTDEEGNEYTEEYARN